MTQQINRLSNLGGGNVGHIAADPNITQTSTTGTTATVLSTITIPASAFPNNGDRIVWTGNYRCVVVNQQGFTVQINVNGVTILTSSVTLQTTHGGVFEVELQRKNNTTIIAAIETTINIFSTIDCGLISSGSTDDVVLEFVGTVNDAADSIVFLSSNLNQ